MAYNDLPVKNSGDLLDLATYDQIRENFNVGVPDIITAKGDLVLGLNVDSAGVLPVGSWGHELIPDSTQAVGLRWQQRPVCKVKNSTTQDPATGAWVPLTWDTDQFDSGTMHSTAVNTSRITAPVEAIYRAGANIGFNTTILTPGTSGHYGVRLIVDGTIEVCTVFDEAEMQSHDIWKLLEIPLVLLANQYVECQVWTSQDVNIMEPSRFWLLYDRVAV